ncbi:MAG: SdpI family protein [Fidelibacterota bacterium]
MKSAKTPFESLKPALLTAIVVFIIITLVAVWAARQLPPDIQLPVHWNVASEPDRYAGKFLGLFIMPMVILGITVLLVFAPYIEPRQKHIKMSMKAYNIIIIGLVLVFAALHVVVIMNALGKPLSIEKIVPALIGLLFIIIGNFMGKVRSNYMLGIKTPWTLSSERAWNKTHRLGGWLFVIVGFLIVLSSLLAAGETTMIILLSGVFGIVIGTFTYSYLIWKRDPDKLPK